MTDLLGYSVLGLMLLCTTSLLFGWPLGRARGLKAFCTGLVIAFVLFAISFDDFDTGVLAFGNEDWAGAAHALERVERGTQHYDSAQALLRIVRKLPATDTASRPVRSRGETPPPQGLTHDIKRQELQRSDTPRAGAATAPSGPRNEMQQTIYTASFFGCSHPDVWNEFGTRDPAAIADRHAREFRSAVRAVAWRGCYDALTRPGEKPGS